MIGPHFRGTHQSQNDTGTHHERKHRGPTSRDLSVWVIIWVPFLGPFFCLRGVLSLFATLSNSKQRFTQWLFPFFLFYFFSFHFVWIHFFGYSDPITRIRYLPRAGCSLSRFTLQNAPLPLK